MLRTIWLRITLSCVLGSLSALPVMADAAPLTAPPGNTVTQAMPQIKAVAPGKETAAEYVADYYAFNMVWKVQRFSPKTEAMALALISKWKKRGGDYYFYMADDLSGFISNQPHEWYRAQIVSIAIASDALRSEAQCPLGTLGNLVQEAAPLNLEAVTKNWREERLAALRHETYYLTRYEKETADVAAALAAYQKEVRPVVHWKNQFFSANGLAPEDVVDPTSREEYRAYLAWKDRERVLTNRQSFCVRNLSELARSIKERIVADYSKEPYLFSELQTVLKASGVSAAVRDEILEKVRKATGGQDLPDFLRPHVP